MDLNNPITAQKIEREICERFHYFFSEIIVQGIPGKQNRLDGNYHWDDSTYFQSNKWCDNCEFYRTYKVPRLSKERQFRDKYGWCAAHKRRTSPFGTCAEYGDIAIRKWAIEPRAHLKTTHYTIAGSLWMLAKDITMTIGIFNQVGDYAMKMLDEIKWNCENNEKMREYWPWLKLENKMRVSPNELTFKNDLGLKEKQIKASGIDSAVESVHLRFIFLDDLNGDKNTSTDTQNDTAWDRFCAIEPLKDDIPRFFGSQTRCRRDDIVGRVFDGENHGWQMRNTELFYKVVTNNENGEKQHCRITMEELKQIVKLQSVKDVVGEYYVPYQLKYPNERMLVDQITDGMKKPYFFMCQYFNNPTGAVENAIREEWIKFLSPEIIKESMPLDLMYWYVLCDMASGAVKRRTCPFGIGTVSVDCYKNVYIWETFEETINMYQFLDKIYELNQKYWFNRHPTFTAESGTIFNAFQTTLELAHKAKVGDLENSPDPDDRKKASELKMPDFWVIPRGGGIGSATKKSRTLNSLQPAFQRNAFGGEYGRIYFVGEQGRDHTKAIYKLLHLTEIEHYDLWDAIADVFTETIIYPNKGNVELELQNRKTMGQPQKEVSILNQKAQKHIRDILNRKSQREGNFVQVGGVRYWEEEWNNMN